MSSTKTADDPAVAVAPGPGLTVGDCLVGRYSLLTFIAAGGMGEVFEAEDRLLGERVAIKAIRPEIARDRRALARFRREVLLSRKVTHRNVCRVFELAHEPRPDGEVPFIVMELLRGETLAARLARAGRMTTTEALPIAARLAAGLDAAHDAGVLHRDFKSANVVLADRPVVTDFGLARPHDPDDRAGPHEGGMSGTPSSMAPEQLTGRPTSPATDVYAFGVVLFEMITGTPPFAGAVRRPDDPAPSARGRLPGLDPRWDAAIARCLAFDPNDRFTRAGDVIAALAGPTTARRRWLVGLTVTAALGGARVAIGALDPPAVESPALEPAALAEPGESPFMRGRAEFWDLLDANKLTDARATLDRLRELPLRGDEDILYDKLEADLAVVLGDFRSMQAWAARAGAKARQRGNQELLAGALDAEQYALSVLGEPQRAQAAIEEIRRIQLEVGDHDGRMRMLGGLAGLAMERGELAEARRMHDAIVEHFRPRGFDRIAGAIGALIEVEFRRGRLAEVDRLLGELAPFRDDKTRYRPQAAAHAMIEGRLAEQRDDLAAARERFTWSLAIYREFADNQRIATAQLALGRVLLRQGDLVGARAGLIEAHTIYKAFGARRLLTDAQTALARVALAEGDLTGAETLAREAETELARQGARDLEALAAVVRAEALVAQGRRGEADTLLAPHLARRSESAEVRTRLAIAAAEPVRLDEAIREATELGLLALAREARERL